MKKIKQLIRLLFRFTLGPTIYEKIQFKRHTGYFLNLKNPATFNEKLVARKLDLTFQHALILQDKYESRKFVKKRVGEEFLTKLYDITDDINKLNTSNYPVKFVIKATNSCGPDSIYIHNSDSFCDSAFLKNKADKILNRHKNLFNRFYYYTNEWWYGKIPTRLIVEEFLEEENRKVPLDYKFFVFHGRVEYIQIDIGRYVKHTRVIYSRDWDIVNVRMGYPTGKHINKPLNLDKMLLVAEKIAKGFNFLRVDLYNINDKIIKFGELTIAPSLGHSKVSPLSFDDHLGGLWNYNVKEPHEDIEV